MLKSKTLWTGVAMVLIGAASFVLPDLGTSLGVGESPTALIGSGLGLIFLRLGIAKNGTGA